MQKRRRRRLLRFPQHSFVCFFQFYTKQINWSASTFEGASAIKSCAFAVFGNAITSRIRLLAREQGHDPIDAQCDAAVWRRSVGQRIEKETETVAQLFLAKARALNTRSCTSC